MNTSKAFTLIELLISISIMSIMAALSISAYPAFSEQISVNGETYKLLGYMRETQSFGYSAVTKPGIKTVYSFLISKGDATTPSTVKRFVLESPTLKTNTYYISSSVVDIDATTTTVKSLFEISEINGIKGGATTSLTEASAFFKRPNPEGRLVGRVGTNIVPDANEGSFDRLEIVLRSKRNIQFQKKVIVLSTGQMYISDW